MRVRLKDLPKEMQEQIAHQPPKGKAKLRRHKPGVMNDLEAAWAEVLEARRIAGEIVYWAFESITLKLADNTRYTPDFFWVDKDGVGWIGETKALWSNGGGWRDDARVKFRVAADKFWPFQFIAVRGRKAAKRDGGGWTWKEEVLP